MKHYALDSSFVINFLKGEDSAKEIYRDRMSGKILLPSPVLMESKRGVPDLDSFEKLETVGFRREEAEEALKIIEFLRKNGEMIGIIDVMIASITITNSLELATYDSDFKKLEEYKDFECKLIEEK